MTPVVAHRNRARVRTSADALTRARGCVAGRLGRLVDGVGHVMGARRHRRFPDIPLLRHIQHRRRRDLNQ